jgi:hypothetical protein
LGSKQCLGRTRSAGQGGRRAVAACGWHSRYIRVYIYIYIHTYKGFGLENSGAHVIKEQGTVACTVGQVAGSGASPFGDRIGCVRTTGWPCDKEINHELGLEGDAGGSFGPRN